MTSPIRISGTDDPVEVAAVVALFARRPNTAEPTAYEQWRFRRTAALRASRRR